MGDLRELYEEATAGRLSLACSKIVVVRYSKLLLSCAVGLTLLACKDEGNSSSKKGPTTSTAATPDTESASLCKDVLVNSWKSMQPALAMMGSEIARYEAEFLGSDDFIKQCSELTVAKLDCLSKSEDPWAGIRECKINDGVDRRDELSLPPFRKESKEPEELKEDQQAKLLKSMVGTWMNEYTNANQVTIWKVSESGDVDESVVRNGEKEEKTLKIAFPNVDRINLIKPKYGGSGFPHNFFAVDEKTVYICQNLAYGVHPIADESDFLLSTSFEDIAFKGESCHVLTREGHLVDAKCAWEQKEGEGRSFNVSFELSSGLTSEQSYDLIAGHLVDHRQVVSSKFVKQ